MVIEVRMWLHDWKEDLWMSENCSVGCMETLEQLMIKIKDALSARGRTDYVTVLVIMVPLLQEHFGSCQRSAVDPNKQVLSKSTL